MGRGRGWVAFLFRGFCHGTGADTQVYPYFFCFGSCLNIVRYRAMAFGEFRH